jgi:Fe-S-cluster containining protein
MSTESLPSPQPASVTANFSLRVGDDMLNASVRLPTTRTTLTQLLPVIQNLENAIVANAASDSDAAGKAISCRAGCGACCRQLVPISLFEAEALSQWLQTLPEDRLAALRDRFGRALTDLRNAGVINGIFDGSSDGDKSTRKQLGIDYFHAGVPCPFLENESCSIYNIRPLICREYLVTSPPIFCQEPTTSNVSGVELPVRLSRVLFSLGKETGQDTRGWIPLVCLFEWAESGSTPGELAAGSGPELLKRFLDRMATAPQHDVSVPSAAGPS